MAGLTRSTEIVSDGLVLRPLSADDAEVMYAAAMESAAELETTMAWFKREMPVDSFQEFAQWAVDAWDAGQHHEFSIFDDARSYLGSVGLTVDGNAMSANLQYWVRTSRTKRGVASRAARLVARWGIEELRLQRVEIFVSGHNVVSQAAARKSGARAEGVLRNKIRWEAEPYDAHIFSFVPGDFDKS
jgi:ribosomal-protein-serine acetyltransferase